MSVYDNFPKRSEVVRYYDADFAREKFPERGHTLREWRELTSKLSPDELERFKALIEESLLKMEK